MNKLSGCAFPYRCSVGQEEYLLSRLVSELENVNQILTGVLKVLNTRYTATHLYHHLVNSHRYFLCDVKIKLVVVELLPSIKKKPNNRTKQPQIKANKNNPNKTWGIISNNLLYNEKKNVIYILHAIYLHGFLFSVSFSFCEQTLIVFWDFLLFCFVWVFCLF